MHTHQFFTLGDLIDALERYPRDMHVQFDFAGCTPTKIASYRGYFADPALGWENSNYPDPTVETLLEELNNALAREYHGWKGGEYSYTRNDSLWVANPGCTGSTAIFAVEKIGGACVLKTTIVDD